MRTLEESLELSKHKETIGGSILFEAANVAKKDKNLIRKFTRRDFEDSEAYTFPCLAIDTTPTRNGVIYSAESQKSSLKDWIGIPFLFNSRANSGLFSGADHTLQAASQYGRIYKAQLVETDKGTVGTLLWVYSFPNASDSVQEFVNKIDTGILREVSIHVIAKDGVVCSICKQSFYTEGHDHIPGEKYGKQTCYMETSGKLEPLELSSVACPGSVVAHVMDEDNAKSMKVLSLREALRGVSSTFEAMMELNPKAALAEASDAPADGSKKDDEERRKKGDEQSRKSDDEECDNEEGKPSDKPDEDEPTSGGKKASKQNFSLLSEGEDCPVCHRKESAHGEITDAVRETVLKDFKEEFLAKLNDVTSSAEKAIKEANDRADVAEKANADSQAMLEYFADQAVEIAIAKGVKTASERDDYREELIQLGFAGIKVLREAFEKTAPAKEARKDALLERARADYKKLPPQMAEKPAQKDASKKALFAANCGPEPRGK